MEAHIRQYDTCLEVVLVLPNIWKTTIFVIGNMYRYIGKVSFRDQKASWSCEFWLIPRESKRLTAEPRSDRPTVTSDRSPTEPDSPTVVRQ